MKHGARNGDNRTFAGGDKPRPLREEPAFPRAAEPLLSAFVLSVLD